MRSTHLRLYLSVALLAALVSGCVRYRCAVDGLRERFSAAQAQPAEEPANEPR